MTNCCGTGFWDRLPGGNNNSAQAVSHPHFPFDYFPTRVHPVVFYSFLIYHQRLSLDSTVISVHSDACSVTSLLSPLEGGQNGVCNFNFSTP